MASERERLDWLERTYGGEGPGLLGIGDDGAYLALGAPHLVVSVDAAIEGVHFRRAWLDWEAVAFRAVQAALSDLAAMGATPAAILSSASLPPKFSDVAFAALARGTSRSAESRGARLIGGNLSAGPHLEMHTTVLGHVPSKDALLTRRGARPGDTLWVTGPLGGAALGLRVLQYLFPLPTPDEGELGDSTQTLTKAVREMPATVDRKGGRALGPEAASAPVTKLLASSHIPERFWQLASACVERWRTPEARIEAGLALRQHATAAIDLSDGLSSDAQALAQASGLTLVIDQTLPSPSYESETAPEGPSTNAELCTDLASELGAHWPSLQAHGGEDYELLFTLPATDEPPCPAFRIGHCIAGTANVHFVSSELSDGVSSGFDHFLQQR